MNNDHTFITSSLRQGGLTLREIKLTNPRGASVR